MRVLCYSLLWLAVLLWSATRRQCSTACRLHFLGLPVKHMLATCQHPASDYKRVVQYVQANWVPPLLMPAL